MKNRTKRNKPFTGRNPVAVAAHFRKAGVYAVQDASSEDQRAISEGLGEYDESLTESKENQPSAQDSTTRDETQPQMAGDSGLSVASPEGVDKPDSNG